jgi:hypothetical protein
VKVTGWLGAVQQAGFDAKQDVMEQVEPWIQKNHVPAFMHYLAQFEANPMDSGLRPGDNLVAEVEQLLKERKIEVGDDGDGAAAVWAGLGDVGIAVMAEGNRGLLIGCDGDGRP